MKSLVLLLVLGVATVESAVGQVPPSPTPVPDQAYTAVTPTPTPMVVGPAIPLYTNVRYKDQRNIAPCAVSKIVQVPDPCNPACCVAVEICVPPCECVCVRTSKCGTKVRYDYGKYAIDITSRHGRLVVDYDD